MITIFPCDSRRSKGVPSGTGDFLRLLIGEQGTPKCWPNFAYYKCLYINAVLLNYASFPATMCFTSVTNDVPLNSNIELIKECQGYFRCLLPSLNVKKRCQKFISKYENSVNTFCEYCNPLRMYIVWLVFFILLFVCMFVFYFCLLPFWWIKMSINSQNSEGVTPWGGAKYSWGKKNLAIFDQ